jgi:hypothetical protein
VAATEVTATTMATTATTPTTTMSMRQARASSENERGERNCRDERFDYLACHRGIPSRDAIAHTLRRNAIITCARKCCSRLCGRGTKLAMYPQALEDDWQLSGCAAPIQIKAAKPSRVAGEMSALGRLC